MAISDIASSAFRPPNRRDRRGDERLLGYDEIAAFRSARAADNLESDVRKVTLTTYGRDYATTNLEFTRNTTERIGRQSQTWLRTDQGWRIVAAHVSLMVPPAK